MTPEERIAAIRERAANAPKGPWRIEEEHHEDAAGLLIITPKGIAGYPNEDYALATVHYGPKTADFLAHAREDIPWLLDCLAVAERRIAELEEDVENAINVMRQHSAASDQCAACGPREARLREALRDRAKQAHHMTIEAWRGIKSRPGTEPHVGMFDTCPAEACVQVRTLLASPSPDEGAGGADAGASEGGTARGADGPAPKVLENS